MKKYSFIRSLLTSFYSKELYQDVLGEWQGKGLRYLFFITFLVSIVTGANIQFAINQFTKETLPHIVSQLKSKEVATNSDLPYTIKDPDSGKVVAIVDPTGSNLSEAPITIHKNEVILQNEDGSISKFNLSTVGIDNSIINKEDITSFFSLIKKYLAICLFPFIFGFFYLFLLIQGLLFAVICLLLSKLLKLFLGFEECLRITFVAMVPSIILKTTFTFLGITYPSSFFVLTVIAYLFFGLYAFKQLIDGKA